MSTRKLHQPPRMIEIDGKLKSNPEYQRNRRARRKFWVDKYKVAKGCEFCGYNTHPSALEFDHIIVTEKSFNVSSGAMARNLKNVFDEIRKCRILCSNCHRVHSVENKHHFIKGLKARGRPKRILDHENIRKEYILGVSMRQLAVSNKASKGTIHKIIHEADG